MKKLDSNPSVLKWSSEEIIIPYISPVDNKPHRYFPDFWVKVQRKDGGSDVYLVEVKPKSQSVEPKVKPLKNAKPSKQYVKQVVTYAINRSKWHAAEEYCKDRNMKFVVLTEDEIFGGK